MYVFMYKGMCHHPVIYAYVYVFFLYVQLTLSKKNNEKLQANLRFRWQPWK